MSKNLNLLEFFNPQQKADYETLIQAGLAFNKSCLRNSHCAIIIDVHGALSTANIGIGENVTKRNLKNFIKK